MAWRLTSAAVAGLATLAIVPAAVAQTPSGALGGEAAAAQTPTPTATPSPSPTATPTPDDGGSADPGAVGAPPEDASKEVRRVYRDFRRDGLITPCLHKLSDLRDTRESVPKEFESEFPDFYESVVAAIEERRGADCKPDADQQATEKPRDDSAKDQGSGGSGGSGSSGGSAAPVAPPATVAPLPPDPAPDDPISPLPPDPLPPIETPAPLPPAPAPVAPTPVAPPVPAPAAVPAAPAVNPEPADPPATLWGLAAGGGLLALGGLVAPLAGAGRGGRLAGFRHAWGEAGFRIRGAWMDFRDWLRVGR